MPELPEVEIIRIGLEERIVGKKIIQISLLNPPSFHGDSLHAQGQKVLNVFRKAKVLVINLSRELTLLFHLKMSGQLIYRPKSYQLKARSFSGGHPTQDMQREMPNRSTRVIFEFNDGSKLFFNDQRKFGWVKLVNSSQLSVDSFLNKLGPEPLEREFNWEVLKDHLLRHKKTHIKVALLDQTVVAGVGNIYANESCFLAGIDPGIRVSQLNDDQFKKIHKGIVVSLKNGVKHGGSSKTHFVDPEGKKGLFLNFAYVYGRDKKPCKVCGSLIKKIKLGGRGTFYCEGCQTN
jgi:formamidopyrimidine-DNA glycosylase